MSEALADCLTIPANLRLRALRELSSRSSGSDGTAEAAEEWLAAHH